MKKDIKHVKGENRVKKEGIIKELSEKVEKAKALVFTNYQGLTHQQLEKLKKALRTANAELVIAKNSLLKIALNQESGIKDMEGPTATLFAYEDIVLPLKELAKTIKLLNLPVIKIGLTRQKTGSKNWDMLSVAEVNRLSTLPTREVLLAQFIGGLKTPIYGLHRALQWNIQKLVLTLGAIQDKKQ